MILKKEPKIGDIIKSGKNKLQFVDGTETCKGCCFKKDAFCPLFNGKLVCLAENRKDGKNGIFIKKPVELKK
mgnify:CR=1 FL=1